MHNFCMNSNGLMPWDIIIIIMCHCLDYNYSDNRHFVREIASDQLVTGDRVD